MEIAPKVRFLPNPTSGPAGTHPSNVFLVGERQATLIDTGIDDEEQIKATLDYLAGAGISRLACILITHAHIDHVGGAAQIKAALGGQIVVGAADVEAANEALSKAELGERATQVDRVVAEGDVVEVDGLHLRVIHTPGHSAGHVCYYLEEGKVLFTGDHVVGAGTTAIAPPPRGDMVDYVASLRKLLQYDAELLCPGHGPIVRVPHRKIQELIDHRLEREEQVLGWLRQGKQTIGEIVAEIYPDLERRLINAARGQVEAHLHKLEREGRVSRLQVGEEARFSLVK